MSTVASTGGRIADTAAVELVGVRAGYGRHEVLRDVSATVPAGRVTAVVGANGAGKSSLLNVVAGILPLLGGDVVRHGTRQVAYVTQHSEVSDRLPITVRATVSMGRWADRGAWRRLTARDRSVVDECLERLDITDLADRHLGDLSGGQRQRALVAQGLAQESDLLLLDEPAAGLDLNAQRLIEQALDATGTTGTTILRVTHDLATAGRSNHCLLLGEGRLIAAGPPAAVLTRELVTKAWGVPPVG